MSQADSNPARGSTRRSEATSKVLSGSGGAATLAEEFDLSVLVELPMDPAVRAGSDKQHPVVTLEGGPATEPFFELRDALTDRIGAVNRATTTGVDLSGSGAFPADDSDSTTAATVGSTDADQ